MSPPSNAFIVSARVAKKENRRATKRTKTATNMARFTACDPVSGKVSGAPKKKRATCSTGCGVHLPTTSAASCCYGLAGAEVRGLERNLRDAPHVDADRRENPADAHAVDEPFLARHALRDF